MPLVQVLGYGVLGEYWLRQKCGALNSAAFHQLERRAWTEIINPMKEQIEESCQGSQASVSIAHLIIEEKSGALLAPILTSILIL